MPTDRPFESETVASLQAEIERLRGALRSALEELEAHRAAATELAVADELTGLLNRKELTRLLGEVMRARRYKHPLSLLLVDVDDLARIDGQQWRRGRAHRRRRAAREPASRRSPSPLWRRGVARHPRECVRPDAVHVAERLRGLVADAAARTKHAATTHPRVTISVGVDPSPRSLNRRPFRARPPRA